MKIGAKSQLCLSRILVAQKASKTKTFLVRSTGATKSEEAGATDIRS